MLSEEEAARFHLMGGECNYLYKLRRERLPADVRDRNEREEREKEEREREKEKEKKEKMEKEKGEGGEGGAESTGSSSTSSEESKLRARMFALGLRLVASSFSNFSLSLSLLKPET